MYWIDGFGMCVVKAVMLEFARQEREGLLPKVDGDNIFDWRQWMEWPMSVVGEECVEIAAS